MAWYYVSVVLVSATFVLVNGQLDCHAAVSLCVPEEQLMQFINPSTGETPIANESQWNSYCQEIEEAASCVETIPECFKFDPTDAIILPREMCQEITYTDFQELISCYQDNIVEVKECISPALDQESDCSTVESSMSCADDIWMAQCEGSADWLNQLANESPDFLSRDCDQSHGVVASSWALPGILTIALFLLAI